MQLKSGYTSRGLSWSIDQIQGKPNTVGPGDISTAWASASQDGQREWIVAEFPRAVDVAKIVVYETHNPGAIDRICSVNFRTRETEIWKGVDPTPSTAAMGASMFSFKPGTFTRRIKIFIDSPAVPGWNEIDAVALHGKDGSIQWVSDAWASTSYGDNRPAPRWYWP
ncbi:MAG: hypothetical protein HKN47_12905 [Pirellulaceae bacterium]|nr:hypothetical protein [Pirellulaceae bacterium]